MQAIAGPWPSLIRKVQSYVLGEDGFGEDLDWGHDRGRDFQCLATIIFLITNHPNPSFPTTPKLEKWLMTPTPVPSKLHDSVLETFQIFIALVKNKKWNTAFQKPSRVSPIEFTMIGVLIYLYKRKYSLTQLSSAIWQMRADVRKQHQDIRANSKVTKTMFTFLKDRLKVNELASDAKGDTPAATAIHKIRPLQAPDIQVKSEPASASKRRRQEPETSEESEYEEAPSKRRASHPQLPSTRSAALKATSSKATVARKVSAPSTKASTSKAAAKTTAKIIKTAQPAQSPTTRATASSSSQSSIPAATKAPATTATPLTRRTTRTSQSAAADSMFGPEPVPSPERVTDLIPPSLTRKRTTKGTFAPRSAQPEAPVVKMEVDPPAASNGQDENAMSVSSP